MFASRSEKKELMDDLTLEGDALRKNLDELELVNRYLGGNNVVIAGLKKLVRDGYISPGKPFRIADIGTGGGDVLRQAADWARKQGLQLEFVGYDANDFMIAYAEEKAAEYPEISFLKRNIWDAEFEEEEFDLAVCSLFCHHLTDEELVTLFKTLHRTARTGILINDLERHPLAYYGIRFLTWLFRGSYLVKHDAPLSVLRAFHKKELLEILRKSDLEAFSEVSRAWAFRFRIMILKPVDVSSS